MLPAMNGRNEWNIAAPRGEVTHPTCRTGMGVNYVDLIFSYKILQECDIFSALGNITFSDWMRNNRSFRFCVKIIGNNENSMPTGDLCIRKCCGKRFRAGHFKLRENLQNIQLYFLSCNLI